MTENSKPTDVRQIKRIQLTSFGNPNQAEVYDPYLKKLTELIDMTSEMLEIAESTKLPGYTEKRIFSYNSEVLALFNFIEQAINNDLGATSKMTKEAFDRIKSYYDNCMNGTRSNTPNHFMEAYLIAKNFAKPQTASEKKNAELVAKLEESVSRVEATEEELNKKNKSIDTIIEELKKKASEQTVSDYAVVFGKEAGKYRTFANRWLSVGIGISVLFIAFMIVISLTKFLPTEVFSENGVFMRYDFTNLVAKILIVAVIVFLMSFAFKQYSVNRHLQTLSQHRQNALNSYKLLAASIIGDDINSRNVLMVQIAKAIYEHSQSTGFLNEKGQNVNSGIVELTKIIGENRPT